MINLASAENRSSNPPELRRALGTTAAAAFVVTNMVGSGIFTVPAFVRGATGSGIASLAVWVVGAGLALSGALCYAELATRMPEAGGKYHYLTRVYGRLFGFLSGWISLIVGFSAAIAAASLGAVAYIDGVFASWNASAPLFGLSFISQGSALAASLVLFFALFHATGVRSSGLLQTIIAALVVGAIVFLVVAGTATGKGNWSGVIQKTTAGGSWWVALIQVSFAYSGWNAAAYLGGEVATPNKTLPRALIGGTLTVAVLYIALNVLFLYSLPADQWRGEIAVGTLAAQRLFGTSGATAVSAIIALTIIGSVSAMTAAGARVYFAMGRDRLAPRFLGRVGSKTQAPAAAILVQAAIAMALALTGTFETLLIYIGSALSIIAGLAVAAVYFVPRSTEQATHFRVPGYPITPALFLIVTAVALIQSLIARPWPTASAIATLAIGVVVFGIGRSFGWIPDRASE